MFSNYAPFRERFFVRGKRLRKYFVKNIIYQRGENEKRAKKTEFKIAHYVDKTDDTRYNEIAKIKL